MHTLCDERLRNASKPNIGKSLYFISKDCAIFQLSIFKLIKFFYCNYLTFRKPCFENDPISTSPDAASSPSSLLPQWVLLTQSFHHGSIPKTYLISYFSMPILFQGLSSPSMKDYMYEAKDAQSRHHYKKRNQNEDENSVFLMDQIFTGIDEIITP